MKIIIAVDSFKGSASSSEVAEWLEVGINKFTEKSEIVKVPIADGGEGTVDALLASLGGQIFHTSVKNPLGKTIQAKYGMIDSETAIIEMAEASGIQCINVSKHEVYSASTYGVGQLIHEAIKKGAKKIYVGLGGSGTNDGGIGMAKALGYSFKDKFGHEISVGLKGLEEIYTIDDTERLKGIDNVEIIALTDVTNPLTGSEGATTIFGPQKGIPIDKIDKVDLSMKNYEKILSKYRNKEIGKVPGAGAAGGLGAGLVAFCNAEIRDGIKEILKLISLEDKIKESDLIITGEGKLDSQSLKGKVPIGIAKLAQEYDCPIIAVVGSFSKNLNMVYDAGIDAVISIIPRPMTLEEALNDVKENVINTGETIARLLFMKRKGE